MITIKELLNRIKWDERLKPGEYALYYLDRISKTLKRTRYTDIKRVEGNFIIIEKQQERVQARGEEKERKKRGKKEEINIPLHRVRRVEKKGSVVWRR